MYYTDEILEHFMNPRNVGEIQGADGIGTIGSEECGDMIRVWIKVANKHLIDIKYKVFGCTAAIAATDISIHINYNDRRFIYFTAYQDRNFLSL